MYNNCKWNILPQTLNPASGVVLFTLVQKCCVQGGGAIVGLDLSHWVQGPFLLNTNSD